MKKLLIIDDSQNVLSMLRELFSADGFTVITTLDAEDGTRLAIENQPDLVIVDTLMPGMDGFDVTKEIKEKLGEKAPKIIMITGSVDAIDAVRARRAGADDYCVKTSDMSNLLNAARNLL